MTSSAVGGGILLLTVLEDDDDEDDELDCLWSAGALPATGVFVLDRKGPSMGAERPRFSCADVAEVVKSFVEETASSLPSVGLAFVDVLLLLRDDDRTS